MPASNAPSKAEPTRKSVKPEATLGMEINVVFVIAVRSHIPNAHTPTLFLSRQVSRSRYINHRLLGSLRSFTPVTLQFLAFAVGE